VVMLLLLLVRPLVHHVAESYDGLGAIAAKIPVEELVADAVMEAVDDVLFRSASVRLSSSRPSPR
jgi:hypothetical protein